MRRAQAHVVLEWRLPPGQGPLVTAALQALMFRTRQEEGCLGCFVSTSASDRITVRYVEDWDSEEHLRTHVRSEAFSALAALVESAIESPRIEFVLRHETRGIEYAEEVRGK